MIVMFGFLYTAAFGELKSYACHTFLNTQILVVGIIFVKLDVSFVEYSSVGGQQVEILPSIIAIWVPSFTLNACAAALRSARHVELLKKF